MSYPLFNTTKKKVIAIAATGFILFGATSAFGQVSFTQITDYITGLFNSEKAEMQNAHATEKALDDSAFNTFITNLKNEITTAITGHNDTEKSRVESEINTYQTNLQAQADQQADADVTTKKAELTTEANRLIQSSKDSLDAKFNELFPAPAPTTTP
jgi:hypothetical protein